MAGARYWADTPLITTALLGGSFNPAHRGHKHISMNARRALNLDEVWWLVSPGNPLKQDAKDMAPLPIRLRSAQRAARRSPIMATAIEQHLDTRFTVDTLRKIIRLYPNRRFIWVMGADNLAQFHRWKDWRKIAKMMPIAVFARPRYDDTARAALAMGWFRQFVRPVNQSKHWTKWRTPALVHLRFRPDKTSATVLRLADPDWQRDFSPHPVRDPITRRMIT